MYLYASTCENFNVHFQILFSITLQAGSHFKSNLFQNNVLLRINVNNLPIEVIFSM